jgi:hypothetical protein
LVAEHGQEFAPACVGYTFSQVVVFHHALYVKVFNGDKPVDVNQPVGLFMKKVSMLVADFNMQPGQLLPGLFPVAGAFLFSGEAALGVSPHPRWSGSLCQVGAS